MIPPGGEGEIQVTLRPKGGHTEITKDIIVLSNDPEQPRFTLTMKGTLLVDMIAQPVTVGLHDLPPGEAGTETFSLRPTEGSTATIESVRVEDATLFSLREIEAEAGALATYELRFAGRKEVGVSATRIVVETILAMAKALKLKTVAEGVETAEQLALLKEEGATLAQGFLFSRPIPADEFEAYMAQPMGSRRTA